MVKLSEIVDVQKSEIVKKLILEKINKIWLKSILLGEKFRASHHSREFTEAGFFNHYVWDNLSEQQRIKTIESLNILIEEDILIDKQPFGNYCFKLLELAILLEKRLPKKINSKPFTIWMEKDFYNLSEPENIHSPLREELRKKINHAFKS